VLTAVGPLRNPARRDDITMQRARGAVQTSARAGSSVRDAPDPCSPSRRRESRLHEENIMRAHQPEPLPSPFPEPEPGPIPGPTPVPDPFPAPDPSAPVRIVDLPPNSPTRGIPVEQ
jgi:hypothetical protein